MGFDVKIVDDAIRAKNWLLRFPPKLEAIFERDTGPQRCRDLIVRAYIGIIIYDLFAFADWWATPDLFWTALWLRVAFFTPVSLLLTATLYAIQNLSCAKASSASAAARSRRGRSSISWPRAGRRRRPRSTSR